MSQQINLQTLSVQVVHENAGVFCGSNLQTGWRSIIKQNQGYGIVSGDSNNLPSNINLVNDMDILDTLITPPGNPQTDSRVQGTREQESKGSEFRNP